MDVHLPTDIWILIITFLPLSSRLAMMQLCRKFHSMAGRCRKLRLFHTEIDAMMNYHCGFMLAVHMSCARVIRAAKLTTDGSIAVNLIPRVENGIIMRGAARQAVDVAVLREFAWLPGGSARDCIVMLAKQQLPDKFTVYYRFCGDSNNILALCGYLWLHTEHLSGQLAN
jgi:hypothetical protein